VFGDNIDTDQIISGKYLTIREPGEMVKHVFESLRPGFHAVVRKGDVIVAGRNFGSGSSREEAPVLLKAIGVSLVIARSFSRLFFRNSINIGLPIVECQACSSSISEGALVEADLEGGIIRDLTSDKEYSAARLPSFLLDILRAGGAVEAYRHESMRSES
jgi:3-isopropylmalate/(R)-2-methylmalate dehydratase small subunit